MRLRNFGILFSALMLLAMPAYALDLQQARASGAVGEKLDGYVTARQNTPEVQALVSEVNAKRRQEYARISQENGQPVNVVAKLAAEQIINGLERGVYYQNPQGGWQQR
jgi:uncharacterized protein YdbL (DUF1318 family)